jgi:hypothetical protein
MLRLFKIVSDLHIDYWCSSYTLQHRCGKILEHPLHMDSFIHTNTQEPVYLIVAGDISDNIDITLQYINSISMYFTKVLFVDGNHEHVQEYPNLLTYDNIQNKINNLKSKNIYYLPSQPVIINKTVYIGYNGWWNYKNDPKHIRSCIDTYFTNWLPLSKNECELFTNNVIERSNTELEYLKNYITMYNQNDLIDTIVIITHTVPSEMLCDEDFFETMGHTDTHKEIISNSTINKKIKYWIYGHTHGRYKSTLLHDIRFIQHARGRPGDSESLNLLENRLNYKPLTIRL